MAKCAQQMANGESVRERESRESNSNLIGSELRSTGFQLDCELEKLEK